MILSADTRELSRIRVKYGEGNRDAKNDAMRDLARIRSIAQVDTYRVLSTIGALTPPGGYNPVLVACCGFCAHDSLRRQP